MKKSFLIGTFFFIGATASPIWANILILPIDFVFPGGHTADSLIKIMSTAIDTFPVTGSDSVKEKKSRPIDTLPVTDTASPKEKRNRLKALQLGLAFGPDLVSISVQNKMDSFSTSKKIVAHSTLGFHAGLAFRLNFKRWFYLNAQPQINFQGANISYDQQGVQAKTNIAPMTLEIPIHFVFKTWKYKLNPAFFIGARYIGDVSEININNPINVKKGETAMEAGVGLEIKFFKRFVFIPSVGAVVGTENLLQNGLGSIGTAIENIRRAKIELHFVFF